MQTQAHNILVSIAILLCSAMLSGQNLVPNPSFEEYSSCPQSFGGEDGQEAMPGVYVYNFVIQYNLNAQVVEERFAGDVTLIR